MHQSHMAWSVSHASVSYGLECIPCISLIWPRVYMYLMHQPHMAQSVSHVLSQVYHMHQSHMARSFGESGEHVGMSAML